MALRQWMKHMDVFDPHIEELLVNEGVEDPAYDFKTITQPQWDFIYKSVFNKSELEEKFYIENNAKQRLQKKMHKLEKYWKKEASSQEHKQQIELLQHLKIGDTVQLPNGLLGTIKYIGPIPTEISKKEMLGIELDEPTPDGHDGQKVFSCKKQHGVWTPRWRIKNVLKTDLPWQLKKKKSSKLSIIEAMEQKFDAELHKKMAEKDSKRDSLPPVPVIPRYNVNDDLPPVTVIPMRAESHIREHSMIPDSKMHFLGMANRIEEAEQIIKDSKEPFWGVLIKQLYDKGFTIEEMGIAFKRTSMTFKWSGQIQIWYQDSKPSCIEQLQFANGDGKPEYVKKVIQRLVDENCKDKTPPPVEEKKEEVILRLEETVGVNLAEVMNTLNM